MKRNLNGVVTEFTADLQKKTGCILKLVCPPQGLFPAIKQHNKEEEKPKDEKDIKYPKISCYDNKSSNSNVGNKQVLYRDLIRKAREHSLKNDCYRLFHLNYGEVREIATRESTRLWPCPSIEEENEVQIKTDVVAADKADDAKKDS